MEARTWLIETVNITLRINNIKYSIIEFVIEEHYFF